MNNEKLNLKNDLSIDVELEKIWSTYYNNNKNPISPLYPEELRKHTIMFLSLFPSLKENDKKFAKRGFYPANPYPLIDCKKSKADNKFYQKFYDLGQDFKSWTVSHLLYERTANQKVLEKRYNKKIITRIDKIFLQNQMKLTFNIINILNPTVVVVCNAGADRFIHNNMVDLNLKQEIPNVSNRYIYKINGIPFITNESKFLGSRFYEYDNKRRMKLVKEIKRVIKTC